MEGALAAYYKADRGSPEGVASREELRTQLAAHGGDQFADNVITNIQKNFDLMQNPATKAYFQDVLPFQMVRLSMLDKYSDMLNESGNPSKAAEIDQQVAQLEQSSLPTMIREQREEYRAVLNAARGMGLPVPR